MQQVSGGQFLAITVAVAVGFFLFGFCGCLVGRQKLRDNPTNPLQRAFGILACIWGVLMCVSGVGLACFGVFGVLLSTSTTPSASATPPTSTAQSTSPLDPQTKVALDATLTQIEKLGDRLVVGQASVAPTTLDEARRAVESVAETPLTAAQAYNGWYLFGTAGSEEEALKFHAGFAIRHNNTKICRFGFW